MKSMKFIFFAVSFCFPVHVYRTDDLAGAVLTGRLKDISDQ